jgi:hypothetical protein
MSDEATTSLLDEPVGDDDLAGLLAARAPRRGLPKATAVLVGAALVAAGFIGGIQVEKGQNSSSGTGGGRAGAFGGAGAAGSTAAANRFRGFFGGGGGGGAGGGSVAGTVKLVQGNTIYVQEANGNIATVTTTGSTTVQASTKSSVSSLTPGTTVTVQGSAGSDGSVAATTITASSSQ